MIIKVVVAFQAGYKNSQLPGWHDQSALLWTSSRLYHCTLNRSLCRPVCSTLELLLSYYHRLDWSRIATGVVWPSFFRPSPLFRLTTSSDPLRANTSAASNSTHLLCEVYLSDFIKL